MNTDIESYIRDNCTWELLPLTIKQLLGNSQKEYEKCVIHYSVKNQLKYRGNLVRHVKKEERSYYEELLRYSREHLMLYPYHLSDFIVTRMRLTPFQYYISIMQNLMEQEKSYDALPNFTAADCLRLLGIGRNQYIDLMNKCRSSKKIFGVRLKSVRELLPVKPIDVPIEPWWIARVGFVTEDDVKIISASEKQLIDKIIDEGPQTAGSLEAKCVKSLYIKGLIYMDVPIEDHDYIVVPPLEGFVMNRVLGDYFETLLYKLFVSLDEQTSVFELANVLQTDLQLVKNAISMYCRLGFAYKKRSDTDPNLYHPSWKGVLSSKQSKARHEDVETFMDALNCELEKEGVVVEFSNPVNKQDSFEEQVPALFGGGSIHSKRIGFLFDSTLTAFLMMGNLSPGLKSHAVTMFEVGKLSDESLDSFLVELEKVADVGEGEARRYFDHALTLRNTILFLRYNSKMVIPVQNGPEGSGEGSISGLGLDLIRCESLQNLDQDTCSRLLNKNYSLLISMAPLTNEIRPITSSHPPHLGPAIPEVNSVWFKLYMYSITHCGPPSLLLVKGTKLRVLPRMFRDHEKLLVTTWGHDPGTMPVSNALPTLNDALCHSALLIQGQGTGGEFIYIPFPFDKNYDTNSGEFSLYNFEYHRAVRTLAKHLDLIHCCGYITMLRLVQNKEANNVQNSASDDLLLNSEDEGGMQQATNLPVNGIASDDSKQLLAAEVDSFQENASVETPKQVFKSKTGNLTLDLDEQPEILDISAEKDNISENDWTVLNCCFGIPLFDSRVNTEVCKRIINQGLCKPESLTKSTASSQELCLNLLKFIKDNQKTIIPCDKNIISIPGCDMELPLPTENLMFIDGKLSPWDWR